MGSLKTKLLCYQKFLYGKLQRHSEYVTEITFEKISSFFYKIFLVIVLNKFGYLGYA